MASYDQSPKSHSPPLNQRDDANIEKKFGAEFNSGENQSFLASGSKPRVGKRENKGGASIDSASQFQQHLNENEMSKDKENTSLLDEKSKGIEGK